MSCIELQEPYRHIDYYFIRYARNIGNNVKTDELENWMSHPATPPELIRYLLRCSLKVDLLKALSFSDEENFVHLKYCLALTTTM